MKSNGHLQQAGHFHAVRFHRNNASLCSMVTAFLVAGLADGQPAFIVATPEHRADILTRLSHAMDVPHLQASGLLALSDAADTLAQFLVDGRVDRQLFEAWVTPTLHELSANAGRPVRVYGEMVDLLWQQGMTAAAAELEVIGNDLARAHGFSVLCGYSASHFLLERDALADICRWHTHVLSERWDENDLHSAGDPRH